MKRVVSYLCLLLCVGLATVSCNDDPTYGEKRKDEKKTIENFIAKNKIQTITLEEFERNDSTTDVSKNQYVYVKGSEVYFQIVEKGSGKHAKPIADGESRNLICRFTERNLQTDTTQLTNMYSSGIPDVMSVSNTSGVFSASFVEGLMMQAYGSQSSSSGYVPEGWISVLPYIKITRRSETDTPAKVRLIVPSTKGQANAMSQVYACWYEITFEGDRR